MQVSEVTVEVRELEESRATLQQETDRLQHELKPLHAALVDTRAQLQEADALLASRTREVETLKDQRLQVARALEESEQQLLLSSHELHELKDAAEDVVSELRSSQDQVDSQRAVVADLRCAETNVK